MYWPWIIAALFHHAADDVITHVVCLLAHNGHLADCRIYRVLG